MVNKKQTSKKKRQGTKKIKAEDFRAEVSQTRSDVESFIEKFKSDVEKKKKGYQLYAQKLRKERQSKK